MWNLLGRSLPLPLYLPLVQSHYLLPSRIIRWFTTDFPFTLFFPIRFFSTHSNADCESGHISVRKGGCRNGEREREREHEHRRMPHSQFGDLPATLWHLLKRWCYSTWTLLFLILKRVCSKWFKHIHIRSHWVSSVHFPTHCFKWILRIICHYFDSCESILRRPSNFSPSSPFVSIAMWFLFNFESLITVCTVILSPVHSTPPRKFCVARKTYGIFKNAITWSNYSMNLTRIAEMTTTAIVIKYPSLAREGRESTRDALWPWPFYKDPTNRLSSDGFSSLSNGHNAKRQSNG